MSDLEYNHEDDPLIPLIVDFDIDEITIKNFVQETQQEKTIKRVETLSKAVIGYQKNKRFFKQQMSPNPSLDGYTQEEKTGAIVFIYTGEEGE